MNRQNFSLKHKVFFQKSGDLKYEHFAYNSFNNAFSGKLKNFKHIKKKILLF